MKSQRKMCCMFVMLPTFLFYCSVFTSLACFFKTWSLFGFTALKNRHLPEMVSRCHKSDCMTNWLFCLWFLFLCLMSFQQSFDPANLMDPHRKHLPPEDVFITRGSMPGICTEVQQQIKVASYQQRGQRGQQTLWEKCLKLLHHALVMVLDCCGL